MDKYKETKLFWNEIFKQHLDKVPPFSQTGIEAIDDAITWLSGEEINALDFGFGSGQMLLQLALESTGTFHGVELSEQACTLAKKRFDQLNIDNVTLKTGSINVLQAYPNHYFNRVILSNVIDNLDPKDGLVLLSEMARLITPKGRLLVKLNPYYDEKALKDNNLQLIKPDFYLEPTGIFLWNLPTKTWLDTFAPYFNCIKSEVITMKHHNQINRLIFLERKI